MYVYNLPVPLQPVSYTHLDVYKRQVYPVYSEATLVVHMGAIIIIIIIFFYGT